MDIVIDGRMILPEMTGVGRYLMGLTRSLSELPFREGLGAQERYELWLQSSLPDRHPIWGSANEHLHLRRLDIDHMQLRQQWVIPQEVRRRKPDVFHYPHFDLPIGVPGAIVATIHDLKYITRPDFFPQLGRVKRWVMLEMMRYTVARAQCVIAVSEFTRKDILHWLGADEEKVLVAPEGVDEGYSQQRSRAEVEQVRQRYGLERPFIFFLGERRPHKNITGLIHAFSVFRSMVPNPYMLLIGGKGYTGYDEPERLVEQMELQEHVRIIDYVPDRDLPLLYRAAEVFALLSHYEGFGLPVLEAMASGTPVVATRATSLPEVVGNAGVLVEPNAAPEEVARALYKAVEEKDNYTALGLAQARAFTWENTARRTLAVYYEAAEDAT